MQEDPLQPAHSPAAAIASGLWAQQFIAATFMPSEALCCLVVNFLEILRFYLLLITKVSSYNPITKGDSHFTYLFIYFL